jgi:hypothetical protein
MWFGCREEGSKSMVGFPMDTFCKFGDSEVATPQSNYFCAALITRPGGFTLLDIFQRNFERVALK